MPSILYEFNGEDTPYGKLTGLLDTSLDHLSAVRIEIRRGRLATAADVAAPLAADADQLEAFAEAHK